MKKNAKVNTPMQIGAKSTRLLVGICSAGAAFALTANSAHAVVTTIYFETFEGTETSVDQYGGFSAFKDDGTDLSSSTSDPMRVNIANSNFYVFIASAAPANVGDSYALLSGAGSVDPTSYQNDLTVSFTSDSTDETAASPEMGWRVLATVGSTIYASDFLGFTQGTPTEKSVAVADAVWHVWNGETDLTDGFNIGSIDGGAGINLAAGSISDIGVLAIDGGSGNDRMRFRDFTISGTVIPEPTSAAMLGLGAMGLLIRRRRRA